MQTFSYLNIKHLKPKKVGSIPCLVLREKVKCDFADSFRRKGGGGKGNPHFRQKGFHKKQVFLVQKHY